MTDMRRLNSTGLVLLWVCAGLGCASPFASGGSVFTSPNSIVRRRAETDLQCPASDLSVAETGGGSFTAVGCGQQVSYVCLVESDNGRICTREGNPTRLPEAAAQPPPPTGQYVAELAAISGRVEECAASGQRLHLTIQTSPDGQISGFNGTVSTATQQECIQAALAGVEVRSVAPPARIQTSFPPPPSPSASTPTRPGSTQGLEGWLDEQLSMHRDAILACVGRELVALRVESTPSGARWSLQGDLTDTPEQECVASVLGDSPGPQPGTLIRVVR